MIDLVSHLDVELRDRPHLLAWDCADVLSVRQLCSSLSAEYINYRDDLIGRTKPSERFLVLDRYIDRELDVLRRYCSQTSRRVVVLHELDVLLAYLQSRPGPMLDVFLERLLRVRHLDALLWIVLPNSCVPTRWPEQRVKNLSLEKATGTLTWN